MPPVFLQKNKKGDAKNPARRICNSLPFVLYYSNQLGGTATNRILSVSATLPPLLGEKGLGLGNPMLKFKDSPELREQIVNIIDDLVNDIVPGYLSPNRISRFDYKKAIYKNVYKDLWREFGKRRSEYADYRDEVFDFLREVPSEKIFTVTELLLKVVCRIVYIQIAIPDNFALNPHRGEKLWSRKESVRNRHIKLFKDSVDDISDRILKNNSKCLYNMKGESVHLVRLDTGLDVPEETDNNQNQRKEDSDVQEPNDNQTPEQHQKRSHGKSWDWRNRKVEYALLGLAFLDVLIGDRLLIRGIHWVWNYLQTLL